MMRAPALLTMPVADGRIGRFLATAMAIGFLALLGAAAATAWSTARNDEHRFWVTHTYEVELAIDRACIAVEQSETARRGYVLTGQRVYLDVYRRTAAEMPRAIDRVAILTRDNPRQVRAVALLRARVTALVAVRERGIALIGMGDLPGGRDAFEAETSARRLSGIRGVADAMVAEERRLLALRDADLRASIVTLYVTLGLAGLLVVIVALISLATILRYTRDLSASRDTVRRFADTLEDQVRERTADLTRANEEIQRFAYIVSHDLRSPLVNVMGFTAELETAATAVDALIERADTVAPGLVGDDARVAAREDLPEAIGFIRTSTQKMDRLINAILKLAREGRRTLAPQRVDIAELSRTVAASLQQQIDASGATFAVEPPFPPLVTDRFSLEQILSNLVENAVKYLDAARPGRIAVRGSPAGARVVIEVVDNGRGIAEADHQRVFDLFRRSGNQDRPGEGIGLAHVRALVYRLGGTIDVVSRLGEGATFRLTLPAVLVEPARDSGGDGA